MNILDAENVTIDSRKIEARTEPTVTAKVLEIQVDKLVEHFNKLAETLSRPKFEEPIPEQKLKSRSIPAANSIPETRESKRVLRSIPEKTTTPEADESEFIVEENVASRADERKSTEKNVSEGSISQSEEKIISKSDSPVRASKTKANIPEEKIDDSARIFRPKETVPEKEIIPESTKSVPEEKILAQSGNTTPKEKNISETNEPSPKESVPEEKKISKIDDSVRLPSPAASIQKEKTVSKSDETAQVVSPTQSVQKGISKKVFGMPHALR